MAIKVFISHQQADSGVARAIAHKLLVDHQIASYLDVIDFQLTKNGEDLAAHIRQQMGTCTQLLAVISQATRLSQWVPWEIGVATEKNYPLATYAGGDVALPEFLESWPYLRSDYDLDQYAAASKSANSVYTATAATLNESVAKSRGTQSFYRDLRTRLRQ